MNYIISEGFLVKWIKLHQYLDLNINGGLSELDLISFDEKFNGFEYRVFVNKDEFDGEKIVLLTVVL